MLDPHEVFGSLIAVILVVGSLVLLGLDKAVPEWLVGADTAGLAWAFGASVNASVRKAKG